MKTLLRGLLLGAFCFPFSFLHAESCWKIAGLEGMEVTALCRSLDIFQGGLLAGTRDHGVFMFGKGGVSPVTGGQWSESMDTLVIHCLAAIDRSLISYPGPLFYAGTNKGLFAYTTFSGRQDAWERVSAIPPSDVWDLLLKDNFLYASADYNIYRSTNPARDFSAWDTLDMTQLFPLGQKPPRFLCLLSAADSANSILAGSGSGDMLSAWAGWTGVVRSTDQGDTWEIWNQGWESGAPNVTALGMYQGFLLAGTDSGVYGRADMDTAYWKKWGFLSGLEGREIRDLHTTLDSGLYAATDSGVYYLYPYISSIPFQPFPPVNGIPQLSVNALASDGGMGKDSLFAGTSGGLYLYTDYDSVGIETAVSDKQPDFTVFPNPFYPAALIPYHLGHGLKGELRIFDIRGKQVFQRSILGSGTAVWDAADLSCGVYVLKVISGGKTYSRKLVLQR